MNFLLKNIITKLKSLEADIDNIQSQLENQIKQLDKKADGLKDNLVVSLKPLLEVERKRNAKVRGNYSCF